MTNNVVISPYYLLKIFANIVKFRKKFMDYRKKIRRAMSGPSLKNYIYGKYEKESFEFVPAVLDSAGDVPASFLYKLFTCKYSKNSIKFLLNYKKIDELDKFIDEMTSN